MELAYDFLFDNGQVSGGVYHERLRAVRFAVPVRRWEGVEYAKDRSPCGVDGLFL